MEKNPFDPVNAEIEARNMEYTPFNLIAERERSNREYRERCARLRELTIEQETKEPTPREAVGAKVERVRAVLSDMNPGSPSAVSLICSCLSDVADVLTFCLDALEPAQVTDPAE